MRAPAARRHGAGDGVQRRPRGAGAGLRRQGFQYLHVVDLDGAFAGEPVNAEAVRRILSGLTMKIQLGGGVRDMKTVATGWRRG